MNIYLHEFKQNFKSTILWIIAICGMTAFYMIFFPMLTKDVTAFTEMLEGMPEAVQNIFMVEMKNLGSLMGYFSLTMTFSFILSSVQASNLGISLLSKEERDKTADFLLTKPVSRSSIVTQKILSALTIFLITYVFYALSSFGVLMCFDGTFDMTQFLLLTGSIPLLEIMFFSLTLLISVFAKKIKTVLPLSLGIVFFFYAISSFVITPKSEKLKYITPFQYFNPKDILEKGSYEISFLVTALVFSVVCITTSYIVYNRRDVHAV